MKQVQRGFTLIELVMVIVILGILGAVALPRYVDLKIEAADASAKATAGAMSSASAMNYGKWLASNKTKGTEIKGATTLCSVLLGLTQTSDAIAVATTGDKVPPCPADGEIVSGCNVKHPDGTGAGWPAQIVCTTAGT